MARTPVIDVSKVTFTKHSLERFVERYRELHPKYPMVKPGKVLREYLARAVVDERVSEKKKKKALAKYGPCLYLRLRKWRFVLKEEKDELLLITAINVIVKKK